MYTHSQTNLVSLGIICIVKNLININFNDDNCQINLLINNLLYLFELKKKKKKNKIKNKYLKYIFI